MADATGARNIVLCADGTGNSGAKGNGTNVWKTYIAVDRYDHEKDPDKTRQHAFYDQGVGTSRLSLFKALGGAFGLGLGANIRQLYTSLAKNYRDGDKIFVFGFSRGAFTVRSLAGMISDIGVIDGHDLDNEVLDGLVAKAYEVYRSNKWRAELAAFAEECAAAGAELREARIHFVGVWDTVDALGVPVDELRDLYYWIVRFFLRPHNDALTSKMDNVYHALAIDDDRHSFEPSVYDETGFAGKVEQVWFAGAHSNVGGGYPRQGMSDVACHWMMKAAESCGLRFAPAARDEIRRERDVHSTLYDPRSGPAVYYRYLPRNVGKLCRGKTAVKVHASVMDRIELATADYAPINLPAELEVVDSGRERFVQCLADSVETRREAIAPAWREIDKRRWLYKIFLLCSLAIAALAVALMVKPDATVELYRQYSIFHKTWTSFWSWTASEVPGWLSRIAGIIGDGMVALTPEPLKNLVAGLLQLPEAVVAILIIGGLLIFARNKLLANIRQQGLELWRRALPG